MAPSASLQLQESVGKRMPTQISLCLPLASLLSSRSRSHTIWVIFPLIISSLLFLLFPFPLSCPQYIELPFSSCLFYHHDQRLTSVFPAYLVTPLVWAADRRGAPSAWQPERRVAAGLHTWIICKAIWTDLDLCPHTTAVSEQLTYSDHPSFAHDGAAVARPGMLPAIPRSALKLKSRIPCLKDLHLNFILIHYVYIISTILITSIIIYPGSDLKYIDALFFSAGAATQSGLNTVDFNLLHTYQQVILNCVTMLTTPIFIHTAVVFIRLSWFEKRFQHVVRNARSLRSTRSRPQPISEDGHLHSHSQGGSGINGHPIVVLHFTRERGPHTTINDLDTLWTTTRNSDPSPTIWETKEEGNPSPLAQPFTRKPTFTGIFRSLTQEKGRPTLPYLS
ncbi:Putative Potassium ion transporter (Eurofung) [Aspergillus calidoustus]|uniref:Putative Potassium ion transporter (Eurofung) n=1 Tax=Aspergillus calidoustus TaxID=454130 RepID=A0A0U5G628_ASPCI|nr:Putative Potassium ion transporter (Eurofung) [Aspergillus calidoustus]